MGNKINRTKLAWPSSKAMAQIYEKNLWGKGHSKFYSGDGSHDFELVEPYVVKLKAFLSSFDPPISVCDLGCGDFNVGGQLVPFSSQYIAVDVVEELVNFNNRTFKYDNLSFLCLDITQDKLPSAECVILRQVLQHLSNSEVSLVLKKLHQYKYLILTEHCPEDDFEPNLDIISGQGIRLKKGSGLDLSSPPFNFKYSNKKEMLSLTPSNHKGLIVTTLYEL